MKAITFLVLLLSQIAASLAHIASVTGPTTYQVTTSSYYPLTFNTFNGPITNEDFSVAVGLHFASSTVGPQALGSFVKNFDLEALGHGSTGTGSFTLNVPLHADKFSSGPGSYVLTAAVTNAVGAQWNVQLLFFNVTFTVSGV